MQGGSAAGASLENQRSWAVCWVTDTMYVVRAFRRAFSETKKFWSVNRNWAFVAAPASGVVLLGRWKGWHTVTDIKQTALFAIFGYAFSWIGSFLINLFR